MQALDVRLLAINHAELAIFPASPNVTHCKQRVVVLGSSDAEGDAVQHNAVERRAGSGILRSSELGKRVALLAVDLMGAEGGGRRG